MRAVAMDTLQSIVLIWSTESVKNEDVKEKYRVKKSSEKTQGQKRF